VFMVVCFVEMRNEERSKTSKPYREPF